MVVVAYIYPKFHQKPSLHQKSPKQLVVRTLNSAVCYVLVNVYRAPFMLHINLQWSRTQIIFQFKGQKRHTRLLVLWGAIPLDHRLLLLPMVLSKENLPYQQEITTKRYKIK